MCIKCYRHMWVRTYVCVKDLLYWIWSIIQYHGRDQIQYHGRKQWGTTFSPLGCRHLGCSSTFSVACLTHSRRHKSLYTRLFCSHTLYSRRRPIWESNSSSKNVNLNDLVIVLHTSTLKTLVYKFIGSKTNKSIIYTQYFKKKKIRF